MKKNLLLFLVLVMALPSCERKAAHRHQELVEEHGQLEEDLVAREDKYATLLQDYQEFAELHRQMLEGKIDTNIMEMEERHKQILEKHARLLEEQQQLVASHSGLEKKHEEGTMTEEEIAREHEKMKEDHKKMMEQHEQMVKEFEQMKQEWHERVMGNN